MASICLYFQIHQPRRLRPYSVFETDGCYFDDVRNRHILDRVVAKCYIPATELMLELIQRYEGRFRLAFSLTGSVLEQLQAAHPRVIELLQKTVATGCVELLSETYHHSLAFLYSEAEFKAQVELHAQAMQKYFGVRPRVFRNTELVYSDRLAQVLRQGGQHHGVLAEGVDRLLGARSPNQVYRSPAPSSLPLLLKNYRLSDDIAFRFSNRSWPHWPLTAEKYAQWIRQLDGSAEVVNLFLDYETIGEHQWAETGIFDFLRELPRQLLRDAPQRFVTPSEAIERNQAAGVVNVYQSPQLTSWADSERDASAWLGNAMQTNAMREVYELEPIIKQASSPQLLETWRNLTTSDHNYYMCTKYFDDGAVHKYFNPYDSPYDSYINFMNVLDDLRSRLGLTV